MKNSILATYAAAGKSSNFNGMCLSNGSLFAKGGKYPLMTGVVRVSVGSHYNKIETVDGEYVYTPDWALISYKDQRSIMLDGFRIFSEEVLDIDQSNKVVKGNCLSVANAEGMIIHENLRGFIAVNKNFHLVRYADGGWMLCSNLGEPLRIQCLAKVNLSAGRRSMFFDERGKLRMNAWEPHYCDVLSF